VKSKVVDGQELDAKWNIREPSDNADGKVRDV